jgi:hypothetical protein
VCCLNGTTVSCTGGRTCNMQFRCVAP